MTEITSSSSLGNTRITLQFDLDRNIDGAARDVQAAINAARTLLPSGLPCNPDLSQGQSGRCADHDPVADLGHADPRPDVRRCLDDPGAENCRRSTASARSTIGGGSLPAVRVELNPTALNHNWSSRLDDVRTAIAASQCQPAQGCGRRRQPPLADRRQRPGRTAAEYPAADRALRQRRRRCAWPTSPTCRGLGAGRAQLRAGQRPARRCC